MYKNVLIISDNQYLSKEFHEITKEFSFENTSFSYSISPFSNIEKFNFIEVAKISIFNLKVDKDIDYIINNYDLVISLHCKQLFPSKLVKSIKCINVHPGYNPINRGWYPQVFAILYNLPVGATIHEIDELLDHGPIIAREFVEKTSYDTSSSLYNKILQKELSLIRKNLKNIVNNTYQIQSPELEGNLYLKKDFNRLLELNMDEELSTKALIDKLRALTHENYDNAYFIDKATGKKIFVRIILNPSEN